MVEIYLIFWGYEFLLLDKLIIVIIFIMWWELMLSDVIRVFVDNVCNVFDFKSYIIYNILNV